MFPATAFDQTGICIADNFIRIIKIAGVGHETVWRFSTRYAHRRSCGLGYRYMSGLPINNDDFLTAVDG